MLDKETVSKMGFHKIDSPNIDENLITCIDKAENYVEEGDPLYTCFSKVKKLSQ